MHSVQHEGLCIDFFFPGSLLLRSYSMTLIIRSILSLHMHLLFTLFGISSLLFTWKILKISLKYRHFRKHFLITPDLELFSFLSNKVLLKFPSLIFASLSPSDIVNIKAVMCLLYFCFTGAKYCIWHLSYTYKSLRE